MNIRPIRNEIDYDRAFLISLLHLSSLENVDNKSYDIIRNESNEIFKNNIRGK